MQLSTKGRYAVMAMTDLAGQGDRARRRRWPRSPSASRLSLAYLEQLFARLRRRGLVISARGPGRRLSAGQAGRPRPRVADVVTAVDEPLRATRCAGDGTVGCMKGGARCLTHDLWEETGRQIRDYLASVSLADVLAGPAAAPSAAAAA